MDKNYTIKLPITVKTDADIINNIINELLTITGPVSHLDIFNSDDHILKYDYSSTILFSGVDYSSIRIYLNSNIDVFDGKQSLFGVSNVKIFNTKKYLNFIYQFNNKIIIKSIEPEFTIKKWHVIKDSNISIEHSKLFYLSLIHCLIKSAHVNYYGYNYNAQLKRIRRFSNVIFS